MQTIKKIKGFGFKGDYILYRGKYRKIQKADRKNKVLEIIL